MIFTKMDTLKIPFFITSKLLKEREKLGLDSDSESFSTDMMKVEDLLISAKYLEEKKHQHHQAVGSLRYVKSTETKNTNELNAWYTKFDLISSDEGKLKGKKIIIKDNLCVAGVQMMNGSDILEGYTPEFDASIISKILNEGGTIIGKAHCENMCVSGASFTNPKGPILNPHNKNHTSGGSSSGVAALIANKEGDMGVGTDSGGSIRIPSSWTGCYGMKPTYGLVPTTGMMCYDNTIDHIGPITRNIFDNAALLEVMAFSDGIDIKQQIPSCIETDYTKLANKDILGMKIGILKEGFGHKTSEKIVDEFVMTAIKKFEKLGAVIQEISIPEHSLSMTLCGGIGTEGFFKTIVEDCGWVNGVRGLYSENLTKCIKHLNIHANKLPKTAKVEFIIGNYLWKKKHGSIYGKSQNLKRVARKAFDKVFNEYELLIMPTMPFRAPEIPKKNCSFETYMLRTSSNDRNNAAFNIIGNPCLSIPIGSVNGLPVGMLLVSKHFDESSIYKAAFAWEKDEHQVI